VWHELATPYVGTWAAGTNITRNGKKPNFVFRVSANDDEVDKFLVRYTRASSSSAASRACC
jgi:branched-chain amino acid transport system substrate-binding protein